jgi:hypothetical protein
MHRVEFEPMIPMFEKAKTVHALDRAATVIGLNMAYDRLFRILNLQATYVGVLISLWLFLFAAQPK